MSAAFLSFDQAPVDEVSIIHTNPSEQLGTSDQIGPLSEFLSRPIKIATFNWVEGSNLRKTVYPWFEYLNNPSVKNKILNYSKFRGDIKLTILMNCNPFKYGCVVGAFKPLVGASATVSPGDPELTISEVRDVSGGVIDDGILSGNSEALIASFMQRQHIMLYPQETTKVEMTLPFLWLQDHFPILNYVDPQVLSLKKLGKVDFASTAPLNSCSAPSINPITIEIFASMENYELAGPSLQRESDEYDETRPISSVASAIANSAGALSSVPFIGAYATATSMIARGIGSIARWFGFSNVNNIGPINPVKVVRATRWADTEAMVPLPKLALDPKNEITIDPTVLGLQPHDDMNIEYICSKPFFAGITTWGDDDPVGTLLQSGVVAPSYYHCTQFVPQPGETALAASQSLTMAPATWIAQNFQFWRGDMRIKFKVLCTKFHRGRLRFVYDPAGWHLNFSEGKVFSKILDLNANNEAEIEIKYQGYRSVIEHPRMISQFAIGVAAPQKLPDVSNNKIFNNHSIAMPSTFDVNQVAGCWGLYVMTDLSAPLDAPAYIQTTVSFHNNEFYAPVDPFQLNFTKQDNSSTIAYVAPTTIIRQSDEFLDTHDTIPNSGNVKTTALLIGGETCKSIRQLLHRWGGADVMNTEAISTLENNQQLYFIKRRFPLYHGRNEATSDLNILGTATDRFHNGGFTNLNYFTPAFLGRRGGINWRFETYNYLDGMSSASGWTGAPMKNLNFTVSRYVSNLLQYSGTDWEYSGLSEFAGTAGSIYPNTDANIFHMKRKLNSFASRALNNGAEVNLPISAGVLQMPEVTAPDYEPNRAMGCNPYIDSNNTYSDYEANEGGLAMPFSQRDCLLIECNMAPDALNNDSPNAPHSYVPVLKSYACGAPDFSLFHFVNVPTVYLTDDFRDPI